MKENNRVPRTRAILEQSAQPENALKKLQDELFDCVVTDYMMPGMDGIELASMIRESSDIPIILYTGRGSEEARARRHQGLGPHPYVVRPARAIDSMFLNTSLLRTVTAGGKYEVSCDF